MPSVKRLVVAWAVLATCIAGTARASSIPALVSSSIGSGWLRTAQASVWFGFDRAVDSATIRVSPDWLDWGFAGSTSIAGAVVTFTPERAFTNGDGMLTATIQVSSGGAQATYERWFSIDDHQPEGLVEKPGVYCAAKPNRDSNRCLLAYSRNLPGEPKVLEGTSWDNGYNYSGARRTDVRLTLVSTVPPNLSDGGDIVRSAYADCEPKRCPYLYKWRVDISDLQPGMWSVDLTIYDLAGNPSFETAYDPFVMMVYPD